MTVGEFATIVEEARDERTEEPRVAEVATVRWRQS
jgi:hypothetical protein